jgi:hypothetical protein
MDVCVKPFLQREFRQSWRQPHVKQLALHINDTFGWQELTMTHCDSWIGVHAHKPDSTRLMYWHDHDVMFVVSSCGQVMDKDRFLADDVVGRATLDLQKVRVWG